MANAYGSERLVLPVMAQAEYYTAAGWILNTADTGGSATPLAAPPTVTVTGGITTDPNCPPPTACTTSSRFSGGLLDLRMTAPNAAGYADVTLDVPAWLEYPWRSAVAEDPTSRVTFGIYKGNNKIIYRRERY
jgi:MSHA biogenesis protein MshQ